MAACGSDGGQPGPLTAGVVPHPPVPPAGPGSGSPEAAMTAGGEVEPHVHLRRRHPAKPPDLPGAGLPQRHCARRPGAPGRPATAGPGTVGSGREHAVQPGAGRQRRGQADRTPLAAIPVRQRVGRSGLRPAAGQGPHAGAREGTGGSDGTRARERHEPPDPAAQVRGVRRDPPGCGNSEAEGPHVRPADHDRRADNRPRAASAADRKPPGGPVRPGPVQPAAGQPIKCPDT